MRPVILLCLLLAIAPLTGCVQSEPAPPSGSTGDRQAPGDPDGSDGGDDVDPGDGGKGNTTGGDGTGKGADTSRPRAIMLTNFGEIVLELYSDLAPQTVQNFGDLATDGYYENVKFHRVIDGFMIQGGDPLTKDDANQARWGTGGPGYSIRDEFACKDGTISTQHPGSYNRPATQCDGKGGFASSHGAAGILSMANSGARSGGSQFFITLDAAPHLDGYHAIFGEVVTGSDIVRAIDKAPTDSRDRPVEPVIIHSIAIDGELPGVTVQKS